MLWRAITVVAVALLIACLFWQRRTIIRLRAELHPPHAVTFSNLHAGNVELSPRETDDDSHVKEIIRLQAEIQRLRDQATESSLLRETNRLLREELEKLMFADGTRTPTVSSAAPQTELSANAVGTSETPDSDKVEAHKKLVICANQLQQVGIAAVLWSEAHDGLRPDSLLSLSNYLAPMMLICPSDTSQPRQFTLHWTRFDSTRITYEMARSPSRLMNSGPFARCPIHNSRVNGFIGVFAPKFYYDSAWGGDIPH